MACSWVLGVGSRENHGNSVAQLCFFEVGTWPHATEEASSYRSKRRRCWVSGFPRGPRNWPGMVRMGSYGYGFKLGKVWIAGFDPKPFETEMSRNSWDDSNSCSKKYPLVAMPWAHLVRWFTEWPQCSRPNGCIFFCQFHVCFFYPKKSLGLSNSRLS